VLTSEGNKRVSSGEVAKCEVTIGYQVLLLSQSLDDLGTTWGECLGRTRWSSSLDSTTYLYYFTSGCIPITTWSHVLPEHSTVTWPCHVVWLSNLLCYLYLDPIVWLDIRDQICECVGDSFLSGALIIHFSVQHKRILAKQCPQHGLLTTTHGMLPQTVKPGRTRQ